MAYTALAKMREKNYNDYGVDVGPKEPELFTDGALNSLKRSALRFIHNSCEGLKFDAEKEAEEERTGEYLGTSLKPKQIPYNMQMDINRLCMERCLEQFIDSGTPRFFPSGQSVSSRSSRKKHRSSNASICALRFSS